MSKQALHMSGMRTVHVSMQSHGEFDNLEEAKEAWFVCVCIHKTDIFTASGIDVNQWVEVRVVSMVFP